MKERAKSGLFLAVISVVVVALISLMFAVLPRNEEMDFGEAFKRIFGVCFIFFGAPGVLGGILMIVATKMAENHCLGFGCGIWYGASILFVIFQDVLKLEGPESSLFFLAFAISSATCYAAWAKGFKEKK